jgi:hypothetical protein
MTRFIKRGLDNRKHETNSKQKRKLTVVGWSPSAADSRSIITICALILSEIGLFKDIA